MSNKSPVTFKQNLRYPGEFSEWLSHEEDADQKILEVTVLDEDQVVAKAYFGYLSEDRGSHLACLEIFVKEDFRRQGVATKCYNLAEEHYQDTCKPYPGHSAGASHFWSSRSK